MERERRREWPGAVVGFLDKTLETVSPLKSRSAMTSNTLSLLRAGLNLAL